MASIIVMSGTNEGDYCLLGRRTNVLGGARYYALDIKSKHGVFINGRKIHDETILADGDQIRIGATTPLFTEKDFADRESALTRFKKVGERRRPTVID